MKHCRGQVLLDGKCVLLAGGDFAQYAISLFLPIQYPVMRTLLLPPSPTFPHIGSQSRPGPAILQWTMRCKAPTRPAAFSVRFHDLQPAASDAALCKNTIGFFLPLNRLSNHAHREKLQWCSIASAQYHPDDYKNDDGAEAPAAQFFGTVASDDGSKEVVHLGQFLLVNR